MCLDSLDGICLICLRPVQSQRGWFPADLFSNALFRVFSVSESLQDKDSSFVAAWDFGEKGGEPMTPPTRSRLGFQMFSAISEIVDVLTHANH